MPDEHASEFAETLAGLNSGDVETSDSEKGGFADIIDEEEIKQIKKDRYTAKFIIIGSLIWILIDADSYFAIIEALLNVMS
jgi:hypothetical protein